MPRAHVPTIDEVLADPAASHWMKDALRSALARDPVDVANEALLQIFLMVAKRISCASFTRVWR